MPRKAINPNSDRNYINTLDITSEHNFPKFLKSLQFNPFRHIPDLTLNFIHPISVVTGTNRSGKTTVLMALACSHLDFQKRNIQNGKLERHTWSSLMKFTNHDKQTQDWTYHIKYKLGRKEETKRGQRKHNTKKWNGIGKKESQFKERQVVFVDLDRIMPARSYSNTIFNIAKTSITSAISASKVSEIESYLSYVLEEDFKLNKIAEHLNKDIFKYKNTNEYSSFNAATGEEVLTKIIIDAVEANNHALILIDEVEMGLHPKIQRRLIDVLYNIARNDNKQFILTTHSPSILSTLPSKCRIFIERNHDGSFKAIPNISVNAALSKMDSITYPLIDLYCEDDISKKIISKAVLSIQKDKKLAGFKDLINVIVSGSSDDTFKYFRTHQATLSQKRIKTGYACILDGDRKTLTKSSSTELLYPPEECLHFIYSNESPEKFLVGAYLSENTNTTLLYHCQYSDPHCLFQKMVELVGCTDVENAFEECWNIFIKSPPGKTYLTELKKFLLSMAKKYSPDL